MTFTLDELEALPMPVGWFDNRPVLNDLSERTRSRADALQLIDRLGPSSNLNLVACLLVTVRAHCIEHKSGSTELMIRLFEKCRFTTHSVFLNTFLPYFLDLIESDGFTRDQSDSVLRILEAALASVEGLCAYGMRSQETLQLSKRLVRGLERTPHFVKATAELCRVAKVHEMRWGK